MHNEAKKEPEHEWQTAIQIGQIMIAWPLLAAAKLYGALMDLVTTALLKEFSKEYELQGFQEDKQFEIMASYLTARLNYSETFNPQDIVAGSGGDLGIDAVAIVVNGSLYTDVDSLNEFLSTNIEYVDATFVFAQSERSNSFDASRPCGRI